MVYLGSLTDDELKVKLLLYGVKAGPIVASTRVLYENMLKRLRDSSAQTSQHWVNGTGGAADLHSDREGQTEMEEHEDKDSESVGDRSCTETSKTGSKVGMFSQSRDFYPGCFTPSAGFVNVTGKSLHKSLDATQSLGQSGSHSSFSIAQMVEELENRFSQSKQREIERTLVQRTKQTVDSRALQDSMRLDKGTMTDRSLCLTSPSAHQKQTATVTAFPHLRLAPLSSGSASSFDLTLLEPVMDVFSEMFPETPKTPTGFYATKRLPIKGAAGRPVQFKYSEMPLLQGPAALQRKEIQQVLLSPTTLEMKEIQQRLVPMWVQIMVFLLVVSLLYLIYSSMEEPLSNPFTALLNGPLISTSQDSSTTDATD